MAKDKRTKTLVYKRAQFIKGDLKLSDILRAAILGHPTCGARRERLSPEDEKPIWRLIGQYRNETDFVFGVLMQYMPGMNPAFLVDDETATAVTVQQLAAPTTADGKRHELVDSMLFFAAFDNHLVMMQSSGLRSRHLELHLQWLLHKSGGVESDNTLQLLDHAPAVVRDRLSSRRVKELDIGGALMPARSAPSGGAAASGAAATSGTAVAPSGGGSTVSESVALRQPGEGILSMLKSLIAPDQAARLNLDAQQESDIEYTLKIRVRKGAPDGDQRLMETLSSAFRHAEGVETAVHLEGGGVIKGDELRLSGPIRIEFYDGVPSADEVFEGMREWLLVKLRSGDA